MTLSTTVTPMSLVMRPFCCFYCGSKEEDDIHQTEVIRLFGIRHCTAHTADADRDCNAYKHRECIVSMEDARDHPVLAPFLITLDSGTIPIRRSSGILEEGWKPNNGSKLDEQFLRQCPERGWMVPMTNGTLAKCIPLSEIADSKEAVEVLDSGVYAKDAEQVSLLVRADNALETPGISLVYCEGRVCRVFNA
jgi:hypothetical protein